MLVLLAVITITAQQTARTSIELGTANSDSGDQAIDLPGEIEFSDPAASALETETISAELTSYSAPSLDGPGAELGILGTPSLSSLSGHQRGLLQDTDRKILGAGGNLNGPIRISLAFTGRDDLDLHVIYEVPNQYHYRKRKSNKSASVPMIQPYRIYYGYKESEHATLDVDANAQVIMFEPCENVIFHSKPPKAKYTIVLDNFAERDDPSPTPYVLVVKYGLDVKVFEGELLPTDRMKEIWSFEY